MRCLVWIVLALFSWVALSGCRSAETATASDSSSAAAEEATWFANGKEARQWLSTPGNVLFEMGNDTGRQWVERFYAAGATSVRICEADKIDTGPAEISAMIGVGLPTDPNKRKQIWPLVNEFEDFTGHDRSTDNGQTHIVFSVD